MSPVHSSMLRFTSIGIDRKQHPHGSPPLPYCLADVQLIPPCDRILLEMTFAELYRWAIAQLRACVIEADMAFKARGINPAQPPLDNSKVGLGQTQGLIGVGCSSHCG